MLEFLSLPNVLLAFAGASGCAIVLVVLLKSGWGVNLAKSEALLAGARPDGLLRNLEGRLREADIPLTPEEFMRASLLWGLALAAAAQLVWGYWALTLLAGLLAPLLYWQYLEGRAERVHEQFMTDLALTVDDLREAYSKNPAPQQAFALIGRSGPPLLRPHFARLAQRVGPGSQSLADALTAIARDVHNPFFDELAEVLNANELRGSQITPVLERHARALRSQVHLLQSARSEQSRMRLESRVVALAPFVLLAIIKQSAPVYADPYYNTLVPGQLTLAAIVLLTLAGYGWMNRLARSGLELRRFGRRFKHHEPSKD